MLCIFFFEYTEKLLTIFFFFWSSKRWSKFFLLFLPKILAKLQDFVTKNKICVKNFTLCNTQSDGNGVIRKNLLAALFVSIGKDKRTTESKLFVVLIERTKKKSWSEYYVKKKNV